MAKPVKNRELKSNIAVWVVVAASGVLAVGIATVIIVLAARSLDPRRQDKMAASVSLIKTTLTVPPMDNEGVRSTRTLRMPHHHSESLQRPL